jgi:putative heme iron utilization protein
MASNMADDTSELGSKDAPASVAAAARPSHTAPASQAPAPPEPPFAERVRTLLHVGRTGTLATLSRRHAGFPFASVMPYGLDHDGRPTFLISTMAMHTRNLESDGRASLLVTQPGWAEDPLAGARATLVGRVDPLGEDAVAAVRDDYLARHETARYWVDFDDFGFWRMAVEEIYFVGGFGAMGWVATGEYDSSTPDPLSDAAARIITHMNDDHADALVLIARHFGNVTADAATITSVDRLGFRLRCRSEDRMQGIRLAFPSEVRSADDARRAFVAMVREARTTTGS